MASVNDWNKYVAVVQELAQVEHDLREALLSPQVGVQGFAHQVLFERFGVDTQPPVL